jgi:hypothetical protein
MYGKARGITFLIFLLSGIFQGFSQSASFDTIPVATGNNTNSPHQITPHKLDYHIQMGSQFTTSSYGSGFSTFVAPHLTYGISKRFSISGGISLVNTTLNGYSYNPWSSEKNSFSGNFTTALVYISGQYQLNNRLTISGTAYKQFGLFGNTPGYNYSSMNDAHGIYMNVSYKVADNVHLEAGFGYSKGYNPYQIFGNDPFYSGSTDPFFHPIH